MVLFLLLLAALLVVGVARTIALVAHDGYGTPGTIPAARRSDDGRQGVLTR